MADLAGLAPLVEQQLHELLDGPTPADAPTPAAQPAPRLPGRYAVLSSNIEGAAVLALFWAEGWQAAEDRRRQLGLGSCPLYLLVDEGN